MLSGLTNFQLCTVWTTIVRALSYLRGPTEKIQGRSLDLYDVVSQVQLARGDLEYARKNCENGILKRCFDYASNIASLVSIKSSKPRIAARQVHRENVNANTVFDYYRLNLCSPFLDHLINGTRYAVRKNCSYDNGSGTICDRNTKRYPHQ